MRSIHRFFRAGFRGGILALAALGFVGTGRSESPISPTPDPAAGLPAIEKIVGPDRCGECHRVEFEAWKASRHATGFREMHRKGAAKAITAKLGLARIKSDTTCIRCHYTPTLRKGRPRASHGVSCEHCHGPAKDWVAVHDDFGGEGANRSVETVDHRRMRIERSRALGMRHPAVLAELVSQCYACHVVNDETLVNVGEHPTGDGMELVSSTQGEVRHKFLESRGETNAPLEAGARRVFFVLGRLLDLEYVLRALSHATEPGRFHTTFQSRLASATKRIAEIESVMGSLPWLEATLGAARSAPEGPGHGDAMLDAASQVNHAIQRFLEDHDGTRLAPLDLLIPGPEGFRGPVWKAR